jgi:type II secretory pathway component PulJ
MKKLIVLLVTVFLFAFIAGVAFASLSSVQKILNDVWDSSNNALQVEITL